MLESEESNQLEPEFISFHSPSLFFADLLVDTGRREDCFFGEKVVMVVLSVLLYMRYSIQSGSPSSPYLPSASLSYFFPALLLA